MKSFYVAVNRGNPYRAASTVQRLSFNTATRIGLAPFAQAHQMVAEVSPFCNFLTTPQSAGAFAHSLRRQHPKTILQTAELLWLSRFSPQVAHPLQHIFFSSTPIAAKHLPPYIPDPWTRDLHELSLLVFFQMRKRGKRKDVKESVMKEEAMEFSLQKRRLDLTYANLSNALGISDTMIGHWVQGRYPIYEGVIDFLQKSRTKHEAISSMEQLKENWTHRIDPKNIFWKEAVRLRALMIYWDISINELAEASGYHSGSIALFCRGEAGRVRYILPLFQEAATKDGILTRLQTLGGGARSSEARHRTLDKAVVPRPFRNAPLNRLVRETRHRLGISLPRFGEYLAVSDKLIADWESGLTPALPYAQERIEVAAKAQNEAQLGNLLAPLHLKPRRRKKPPDRLTPDEREIVAKTLQEHGQTIEKLVHHIVDRAFEDEVDDLRSYVLEQLSRETSFRTPNAVIHSSWLARVIRARSKNLFWEKSGFSRVEISFYRVMSRWKKEFMRHHQHSPTSEDFAHDENVSLEDAEASMQKFRLLKARLEKVSFDERFM